ncbi:MAG: ATP-grasp domain-containing protein [Clostridia bacterium]|nr:ATP-grasp domain-containing protein [Clostridia bacterium]
MAKNIIIVYGGSSTEHDVSIVTALQVYKRYSIENVSVHLVYIDREDKWYIGEALDSFQFYKKNDLSKLKKVKLEIGSNFLLCDKGVGKAKKLFQVDFIINCCHGGNGESGNLTSLFEMCGIPSSTGDSTSLNVAMDKHMTKMMSLALDIPTVDFFVVSKHEWQTIRVKINEQIEQFGFPVVVKPARQGSSVGVCVANSLQEFEKALNFAYDFDEKVIVERAIVNKREFNCCLIKKNERVISASIEEPKASDIVITFNDKYLGGKDSKSVKSGVKSCGFRGVGMDGAERQIPADIPTKLKNEIIRYAKTIYQAIDMCGVVRIDFIMDTETKKVYLGEINSIPGSLGYYFWGELNLLDILYESGTIYWKQRFLKQKSTPSAKIFV